VLDHGATLSGAGTFANAVTDNGALIASAGGTLAFYGALTGTGTLSAGAGGLLDMKTGVALTETIAGAGVLELEGASNSLAGGTVSIGTLALATGATLSGYGIIAGSLIDNGTVTASGIGTLVLSKAISGNGVLQANSVLDLAAGGVLNNAISGAGVLELSGAYTLGTGALSVADLLIDSGASLSGKGTLTSTLFGTGFATGSLVAASGGTLTLAGGGIFAGALAGPGTIDIADALTLDSGASLSAANIIATADIYLDDSTSVTQSVGSTLTLESANKALLDLYGYGATNFTEAGSLVSNGAGTASVNVAFTNLGSVTLTAGKMQFLAAVTNNGTIDAAAGVLKIETAVSGSGTLDVGAGGTLSLLAGAATGQTLSFLSTNGLLDLTKPIDFKSLITGFGASDQIDLLKTKETSFSYDNNTLTVLDGHKTEASLHFSGSYTQSDFTLTTDGHGGTLIKFV
jgi:hypothetical protein